MSNLIDNRTTHLKGKMSQMNDIDDAFRDLVANHEGWNMGKAKTFSKVYSPKPITIKNLLVLAIEMGAKFRIDPILDVFEIWYAPKGMKPVEMPESAPEDIEKPKSKFEDVPVVEVEATIPPEDDEDLF